MKFKCISSTEKIYLHIECNASDKVNGYGSNCDGYTDSKYQSNKLDCETPYVSTNTQISTEKGKSDSDNITSPTTVSEVNTINACNYSNLTSVVVVLGALVGLFVVLVVVATTGWIWTYFVMSKRGRVNSSSVSVG